MNTYHIDFNVNGKSNPHGLYVSATSLLASVEMAVSTLHRVYDGVVDSFEIVSASFVKCS